MKNSKFTLKNLKSSLGRKKPVSKGVEQASREKTLTWLDLSAYGVAATVGSGIYVTCGTVARNFTGPAVIISIGIAGLLSFLTGICYLEFASSLPISGSGYAYFYTMLGEFLGWVIGWNLTFEYAFAAAAIAGGLINDLVTFIRLSTGLQVPTVLYQVFPLEGIETFRINLLAALFILLMGTAVSRGIKFGSIVTNIITCLNISVILFIISTGIFYVKPENLTPFFPQIIDSGTGIKNSIATNIMAGGGKMFFSYIGYDTISSLAGEAINPSRDLPIAVFITIGIATLLYMGVGLVLTGIVNYTKLSKQSPLANAFLSLGLTKSSFIVSVGSIVCMAATTFACLMGQPKIFQTIAQDGLLPRALAREDKRGTPIGSVAFTTILTAVLTLFLDVDLGLIDCITFGTLLGMSALCTALMVVRFEQHRPVYKLGTFLAIFYLLGTMVIGYLAKLLEGSENFYMIIGVSSAILCGLPFLALCFLFIKYGNALASRSLAFTCPFMPVIPCIAIFANNFMAMKMDSFVVSILEFLAWTFIGLIIYFFYGMDHSELAVYHKSDDTIDQDL